MVLNGRSLIGICNLRWGGCSCHNSKNERRRVKKSAKRKETASWKRFELE